MSSQTADTEPLFPPSLISKAVQSELPEGYICRPLQKSDYKSGFLGVLSVLTTVGEIGEAQWTERFEYMASRSDTYFVLCIINGIGKVVGTGALFVERKL